MAEPANLDAEITTRDSFEALLREDSRALRAARRSGFLPGSRLGGGRYAITRRIGRGGMSFVYEALDAERHAKVAIKTPSCFDPRGKDRLEDEFQTLAAIEHANLVRVYELAVEGDARFFTMERVHGVRFDRWVRPRAADCAADSIGVLDEARLRAALPQLASALLAIHGASKVHRDLKPGNVLVTGEGRVVVLDLGLAIDAEPAPACQRVCSGASGTPAYMAPEQAALRRATPASDVYALGVMLFEALTGALPFVGDERQLRVGKQIGPAPSVRARSPEAPADLAALCCELLQREPADRPSANALVGRLDGA